MIVIDVGCATWGNEGSVKPLIEEFEPAIIYGFDPGLEWPVHTWSGTTEVILSQEAAWLHTGIVGFEVANLGGHVAEKHGPKHSCFDLAQFIFSLPGVHEIVLKMDAEGAEYKLVPHLRDQNADLRLKLARVEWHCAACGYGIWNNDHPDGCTADQKAWLIRRNATEALLRCPVDEWTR